MPGGGVALQQVSTCLSVCVCVCVGVHTHTHTLMGDPSLQVCLWFPALLVVQSSLLKRTFYFLKVMFFGLRLGILLIN